MKNLTLPSNFSYILLASSFIFSSFSAQSQLHLPVSCGSLPTQGTIDWSSTPTGSSQFNWLPAGAVTNTFTNISGTGVDATITFTGDIGTFGFWGSQTPSIGANPTGGVEECLQLLTTGFPTGISLTLDFSTPISEIGFDLAHVNALPGANGDVFTIIGLNEQGQIIYPTITPSANPSYTFDAFGNIDANSPSTAGDNDEVGIHLSDPGRLVSFTIFWGNCSTCTPVIHGLGIKDIEFCVSDLDGDLVGDHIDIDDDNDGIIDLTESGGFDPLTDVDGDGVFAYLDDNDFDPSVFNNDGLVETAFDFDRDNVANHYDLDSDNDAIADIIEAGGIDANGDGQADYPTVGVPTSMLDVNQDGLSDDYDVNAGGVTIPLYNTDLVGNPDYLDLDSDNDGIGDNIELNLGNTADDLGGGTTLDGMVGNGFIIDADRNGWSDAHEGPDTRLDSDSDGLFDMLEIDADNDGIRDFLEGVCTACPAFGNAAVIDSDGDGFSDQYENLTAGNLNGGGNQGVNPNDHDGNSRPDYLDLDSDGDGGFDWTEGYDVSGDGIAAPEFEATAAAYVLAGGPVANYPIVHSDGDIVPDFSDNQPLTFGYIENVRPPFFNATSPEWVDADNDGLVDLLDADISGNAWGQYAPLPNTDALGDRDWRDVNTIVILPIELLTFTATPLEREVQLDWETASEKDADYFILERSKDAFNWEEIAEVDAVGNSTSLNAYGWLDQSPLSGISYYRLKLVDINQTFDYSQIEVVNRINPDEVLLYPNPAKQLTTLKAEFDSASEIQLLSVTGAVVLVKSAPMGGSITFDVSSLESGCYYFSFVLANKERVTKKLIVSPK